MPTLARRKSQRYFIERSIQDTKSDLGLDEFQAIKFLAWQHHLALTILAAWFVAETKLDWAIDHQRDPVLLADCEIDILPALSMGNLRTLLRAGLPLPQLTIAGATALVVKIWITVPVLVNPASNAVQPIWGLECDIVVLGIFIVKSNIKQEIQPSIQKGFLPRVDSPCNITIIRTSLFS